MNDVQVSSEKTVRPIHQYVNIYPIFPQPDPGLREPAVLTVAFKIIMLCIPFVQIVLVFYLLRTFFPTEFKIIKHKIESAKLGRTAGFNRLEKIYQGLFDDTATFKRVVNLNKIITAIGGLHFICQEDGTLEYQRKEGRTNFYVYKFEDLNTCFINLKKIEETLAS